MKLLQNFLNPASYHLFIAIFFMSCPWLSQAQFTRDEAASIVIQDMAGTKADWGDYDNDGDLDIAVIGGHGGRHAKIYKNTNGTFEDIEADLQDISDYGYVMWGDFDNDNDLDLLITGQTVFGEFPDMVDVNISYVYRNDDGVFVNQNAGLIGVAGWGQWSDYDHDGDLDIGLVGSPTENEANDVIKIYNNEGGIFTEIDVPIQPTRRSIGASIDWGDYDHDGDEDLFVSATGESDEALENWLSVIFNNDEGVFTAVYPEIHGLFASHVKWGDYDDDDDLDIAVMGINREDDEVTTIYENDEGSFVDIGTDFGNNDVDSEMAWGFLDWEDYDTDGDLDILVSGKNGGVFTTKIYNNDGGVFTDIDAPLPGTLGYAIWGDYDNDFDPDVLLGGVQPVGEWYENLTELYVNEIRDSHTIEFDPIEDKIYGAPSFDLSAQSSAELEVHFDVISGPAILEGHSIQTNGVGEVIIQAYHSGNETHNPSYTKQLFLVKKADLAITAINESITYGDAIPELGVSYDGFVSGETVTDLLESPEVSTTAESESGVGSYEIHLSGGASDNYEFIFTDGSLTIEKANLTATANNKSIAYGDAIPELGISYDGFVNGEDATDLLEIPEASIAAIGGGGAGSYEINLAGGASDNYDLVLIDGSLTIEKTILTATANNKSITYGDAIPELSISYDGFVNGEDATDLQEIPIASTMALEGSDAGTYAIRISGGQSNNYEFTFVDGLLTIAEVVLEITTEKAQVVVYPNPVRNILTIDGEGWTQIEVYDLHGQVLISKRHDPVLDVSVLPSGLYMLHLKDERGTNILKQKILKLN